MYLFKIPFKIWKFPKRYILTYKCVYVQEVFHSSNNGTVSETSMDISMLLSLQNSLMDYYKRSKDFMVYQLYPHVFLQTLMLELCAIQYFLWQWKMWIHNNDVYIYSEYRIYSAFHIFYMKFDRNQTETKRNLMNGNLKW